MFDPIGFSTQALKGSPAEQPVQRILAAALEAVEPRRAIQKFVQLKGSKLVVENQEYDLDEFQRVLVVGAGKASMSMAEGLVEILGERLDGGVVIPKAEPTGNDLIGGKIAVIQGGHPIPDERSVQASRRLLSVVENLKKEDLVLCVISGGGSALMAKPIEGVTLAELQELTSVLLAVGATIHEINMLRKHLDLIKGGGLLRQTAPARVITLILSDVVGNSLDTIASGPTAADPATFADALEVIRHYRITDRTPARILLALERGVQGVLPDTLKPGDRQMERVQNVLVGSNILAAQAALEQSRREGFNPLLLTTYLQGEANQVGGLMAALARQMVATGEPVRAPACVVAGGETTVTIQGKGRGGRNQEVALGAVTGIAGLEKIALVTLATDGEDGPTDAAGAVVTGNTLARGFELGMDPRDYLKNNDSNSYFSRLGDLLRPGQTGTNVNDLTFLFTFK